jgi:hypothetical protein
VEILGYCLCLMFCWTFLKSTGWLWARWSTLTALTLDCCGDFFCTVPATAKQQMNNLMLRR